MATQVSAPFCLLCACYLDFASFAVHGSYNLWMITQWMHSFLAPHETLHTSLFFHFHAHRSWVNDQLGIAKPHFFYLVELAIGCNLYPRGTHGIRLNLEFHPRLCHCLFFLYLAFPGSISLVITCVWDLGLESADLRWWPYHKQMEQISTWTSRHQPDKTFFF